ncbi:MAG TPA: tripartite tricarboxylate transporter TctB family protein [Casimicrobiaceae bacterium]|nr:tripartite tricarboxylate transporter TctB family protein [Casimicrobiaceae bacterium]
MSMIRNPKEFGSGCLFALAGLAAIGVGYAYPVGTAARMGPGYFPRALGMILVALGLVLIVKGLRTQGPRISIPTLQPLAIVLGSVLLFGLTVVPLGLVLSTILLVVASSVASHEFRWKEALIASLVLAAFVVVAFTWGLKLQLPVWPRFIVGS